MTAPDRRELEEALALNSGDYKAWVKAHGKLRDAVLRLEAELAACLAQNEKIAEMRIDDCERAEAAESKIAIIEAELAKERENREREKAEDVRLVEAAHNRAEAAEKEAAAWKSQSYADIVALGVMTKERDAARAEAERLREALVRAVKFMRARSMDDGWDKSEIAHCAAAITPAPSEPAEKPSASPHPFPCVLCGGDHASVQCI